MSEPKFNFDAMRITLDDIQMGIIKSKITLEIPQRTVKFDNIGSAIKSEEKVSPYIKVTLRKTSDIVLFEQPSITASLDSDEGKLVEEDNKLYEYFTEGKGRRRRTLSAEAQTPDILYKSRGVNTETITKDHVGSYVSNFEMFDTYKDLEASTKCLNVNGKKKIEITTYKLHGIDQFAEINRNENFKLALMITMRILAGNVYEQQQRRFRNMSMPDPLAMEVSYLYRLDLLWRYLSQSSTAGEKPKAIADMSWCPRNGDILAVAYGIYTYKDINTTSQGGEVCVWNIKNPVNPERHYYYQTPVVTVEFSPFTPQLLAVGLYDGSIEVLNITYMQSPPVAVSQRTKKSPNYSPVVAIKWIPLSKDALESCKIEPFLALSRDGSVTKYRIINSPYLMGSQKLYLDRVEGNPEGIQVERANRNAELLSCRHPQGMSLALNPLQRNIYYVLTDEGCMHKCSTTNSMQQHLEVLQLHGAAINAMEFSPWSPKLFLTCGNDWYIRIWMEGILKPIITLQNGIGPVHSASWSKTHSTVIVAVKRKTIDIWDIKRSVLKPVSSTTIDTSFHTLFKLSNCGRSIAVGNEDGNVLMLAFEDMPFPPHYQYNHLKSAIIKAISFDEALLKEVKCIGYFGYLKDRRKKLKKCEKSIKI